jgi:hypothetical protein
LLNSESISLFFCQIVRVKLQKFVNRRINVLATIGKQKYMSWAPENKAVVLLDLCREGHSECITDHLWPVNTTLLSLAESTVIFFSGVVKTYKKRLLSPRQKD